MLLTKENVQFGDALDFYDQWALPTAIISNGVCGDNNLDRHVHSSSDLQRWYESHIQAWTNNSSPRTTLWFLADELEWATVHPLLIQHGWHYHSLTTPLKNNHQKRSEIVARYTLSTQYWLRREWLRTGLNLKEANTACHVSAAASRKYLASDRQWASPSKHRWQQLSNYANQFGDPVNKPYFSWNDQCDVSLFQPILPPLPSNFNTEDIPIDSERVTGVVKQRTLRNMETLITHSTEPLDVVWEPFGGGFSACIAAWRLGRIPCGAESDTEIYRLSKERSEWSQPYLFNIS